MGLWCQPPSHLTFCRWLSQRTECDKCGGLSFCLPPLSCSGCWMCRWWALLFLVEHDTHQLAGISFFCFGLRCGIGKCTMWANRNQPDRLSSIFCFIFLSRLFIYAEIWIFFGLVKPFEPFCRGDVTLRNEDNLCSFLVRPFSLKPLKSIEQSKQRDNLVLYYSLWNSWSTWSTVVVLEMYTHTQPNNLYDF